MRCPFCNFEDTKVVDSRSIDGKKRRRRECTNCGKRFTTYEAVEMPVLLVVKRDNTIELSDSVNVVEIFGYSSKDVFPNTNFDEYKPTVLDGKIILAPHSIALVYMK